MADTNRVGTCVPGALQNPGTLQAYDFCASKSTDQVNACKGFTWINNTTYYESNNTDFHVLTNTAGCDSIIYLDLTINPDIDITNNSSYLTANAENAVYQWVDCDNNYAPISGETDREFNFTENGNYAVINTQNGCTDTSECVNISNVSLFEEKQDDISIYPNPTTGKVNITSAEPVHFEVLDATGRTIYREEAKSKSHTIDLANHQTGVYLIQLNSINQVRTYRIILQ